VKLKPIVHGILAVAVVAMMAGCKEEEYELRFSHYLHVEDNGMDCSDCHGEPGEFKPVSHAACIDCHDEPEADKISVETCGICHQEKQLPAFEGFEYKAPEATAEESVFVHTEALAGTCADCHGSLLQEELKTVPMLERSDVLAIRENAHQSGQDCMVCHVDMAVDKTPLSHDLAWQKRHGQFGMMQDAACSVCHTQDSCKDCHNVMQPVSHNNLFRTRTHGVMAAWDRNTCMVCHEEDSCTTCHSETRPRSHNVRWAASGLKPTHCIGCHDTSTAGDGCVTCHEGGNDVMLHEKYWGGAPINHNQPGIENCYNCHWMQAPAGTLGK